MNTHSKAPSHVYSSQVNCFLFAWVKTPDCLISGDVLPLPSSSSSVSGSRAFVLFPHHTTVLCLNMPLGLGLEPCWNFASLFSLKLGLAFSLCLLSGILPQYSVSLLGPKMRNTSLVFKYLGPSGLEPSDVRASLSCRKALYFQDGLVDGRRSLTAILPLLY
jgi:hypothetical protein